MTTSAQALNEVLAVISKRASSNERFMAAVAKHLGIEGDLAEPEAAKYLYSIFIQIEKEIENLELEPSERKLLVDNLAKFNGFKTMAFGHLTVEHAKRNFLKDENLVGLTFVHFALNGIANLSTLPNDAKELAQDARDLAGSIASSSLPIRVKKILSERILQVSAALDHYSFVGPEAMERQLEGLLGALALNADSAESEEDRTLLQRTFEICGKGVKTLKTAKEAWELSIAAWETGQQIWEMLPKQSG